MTALADVALRFAKECMGWEDARITGGREWVGYNWQIDPTEPAQSGCALFDYAELNAVMVAAREWHRKHGLFLSIYCYPQIDAFSVVIFDATFTVDCEHQNLCHALMQSCLDANSKLKALL